MQRVSILINSNMMNKEKHKYNLITTKVELTLTSPLTTLTTPLLPTLPLSTRTNELRKQGTALSSRHQQESRQQ
jgi:hypothetical protein